MYTRQNRENNQLRPIEIIANYYDHAEGSCLISVGNTKIICVATIEEKVPPFIRGTGKGWLTAEYGMLPRSCLTRIDREALRGKQSPRTSEIQRLIGRSLRAALDLSKLGERQIKIDCDVIRADGGTRTAAITGGYVALAMAIDKLIERKAVRNNPLLRQVAAVSCGVVNNNVMVDLDYIEDSTAAVDANFVLTQEGEIIEIQASSESSPLKEEDFLKMLDVAKTNIITLFNAQQGALQK